jgi:hypothetical protein
VTTIGKREEYPRITNPWHMPDIHKEIPAPSQIPTGRRDIKTLSSRSSPDTPSARWWVSTTFRLFVGIDITGTEDWGRTDCNEPGVAPCECDLNGDGKCDMLDWLLFGEDWGRTDCPIP